MRELQRRPSQKILTIWLVFFGANTWSALVKTGEGRRIGFTLKRRMLEVTFRCELPLLSDLSAFTQAANYPSINRWQLIKRRPWGFWDSAALLSVTKRKRAPLIKGFWLISSNCSKSGTTLRVCNHGKPESEERKRGTKRESQKATHFD